MLVILIALAGGFFISKSVMAPSIGVVDGIYRNECCGDIVMNGEHISQGSKTLAVKVRNMKFGLTGYVDGKFTNAGMQESDEATAITFFSEGGRRALSLPIDGRDYTFRSAESATAR